MMDQLTAVLNGFRFRFITERDLQDGIEAAFIERQIEYRRELVLSAADRPDFMVGRVRDPDADLIERLEGQEGNVRRLAQSYLDGLGLTKINVVNGV